MEIDKSEENVSETQQEIKKNTTLSMDETNLINNEEIPEKNTNDPVLKDVFKKPMLLIGPRKGLPIKVKTISQDAVEHEIFTNSEQQSDNNLKNELLLSLKKPEKLIEFPVETQRERKTTVPYTEPPWSATPHEIYSLEVLKSGVILETIDLTDKSYHIVGRLPSCDISMAHPTISRYHAVIQYRSIADDKNEKGLYLYDLGSTHGTFWNGNLIKPKVYVRLQGGHMIRFGCSQRKFIVQAPEDDQEEESKFSVTELKEMRRLELEERERLEKQQLQEEEEKERLREENEESEGIDWGMGEDADEETDLTENPYAQTNNEELFLNDPKKTLRGWFEREGFDLQYQTEDKGVGKFLCWVDLPLDNTVGRIVRAEALVTGKKKEAVIQCALEACRVLDRYGLLRQANHEARKRKSRNWEEEDFYDSDEDNFLDRTGTIENKRKKRMELAGKLETRAETYESLLEKHSKIAESITNIENAVASQKMKQEETNDSNVDALDAFMSNLDSSTLDKTEIRKMKIELINLRKEEMQLLKLINIAKPANLPPLKPHVPNIAKISKNSTTDSKSIIGQKQKSKPPSKKCKTSSTESVGEDEDANNEDSLNEAEKRLEKPDKKEIFGRDEKTKKNERLDSKNKCADSVTAVDESNREIEKNEELTRRKIRNTKRNQQRIDKAAKELKKSYEEDDFREDYSMWLPPQNQSGDGKTSLNEKFGY